jgi:predicted phosphodiesterase
MRILHVTDFHFNKRWFDWLATKAPECDLVCHTGDFLDLFSKVPVPTQIRRVAKWLARVRSPLLFCSGNHDVEAEAGQAGAWLRSQLSPFAWGDGTTMSRGGVTLVSSGWSTPCHLEGSVDVLLRHAPPGGCATAVSRVDGQDWGDFNLGEDLRIGLLPVGIVLSGHQHSPWKWHGRCGAAISFNPGLNAGAGVPNYILLDLAGRRMARWHEGGQLAGALRLPDAPDWPEEPGPAALDAKGRTRLRRPRMSTTTKGMPLCGPQGAAAALATQKLRPTWVIAG